MARLFFFFVQRVDLIVGVPDWVGVATAGRNLAWSPRRRIWLSAPAKETATQAGRVPGKSMRSGRPGGTRTPNQGVMSALL